MIVPIQIVYLDIQDRNLSNSYVNQDYSWTCDKALEASVDPPS